MNLGLDFQRSSARAGESDALVARVYVGLACGYLSGQGAPTITRDCVTYQEFEQEIERLKRECDLILARAGSQFSGAREAPPASAASPGAVPPVAEKKPLQIGGELRVEDRMTREVRTLRRNDKLSVAHDLMKLGSFRHVLVLDDSEDRLVGVISHRDIFYNALAWSAGLGERAHARVLEQMPVKEVMSQDPETVSPTTPLREAAQRMFERKLGCMPVVEGERVVGILTEGDFLSLLAGASAS